MGLGGILRDEKGTVLAAWALRIAVSWSVEIAELMAIKEGLVIAVKLGLHVQSLECDASNVVRNFNGEYPFSPLASLFNEVRELFYTIGGDSCCAISRDANSVAHSFVTSISLDMRDKSLGR